MSNIEDEPTPTLFSVSSSSSLTSLGSTPSTPQLTLKSLKTDENFTTEPEPKPIVKSRILFLKLLSIIFHKKNLYIKLNSFFLVELSKQIFLEEVPIGSDTSSQASYLPNLSTCSSSSSLNINAMNSQSSQPTRTVHNVNENLQQIHKQIQVEILKQLLKLKNVSFEWLDIILPLISKCVDLVKPDVKHDNDCMDIRHYIKIKKLPADSKKDCRIVNGLVFTKNIAHKQMKKEMKNPKILLLRSSIEYTRSEKLVALEPIYTAESQYLKNYCSKLLLKQNPDILIVEKSVAR